MGRQRGNDGTRKLRAERLAKYAKQVDAAVVEGRTTATPDLQVSVGYEDEEKAHTRSTVAPPPENPDGAGVLDVVPVLVVPREAVAWLSVDHDAELLLKAIDGQSRAREIVGSSKLSDARATLLLVQLEAAGIIRFR